MTPKIFNFLKNYGYETDRIDRLIVSAYININELKFQYNTLLKQYHISDESDEYSKLIEFISLVKKETNDNFVLENLIQLFEFVVSPADKEVNGAVYTPDFIRKFILDNIFANPQVKNSFTNLRYADIACGCGSFLIDIAKYIRNKTLKPYSEIFRDNLFGLDIQEYSIIRTRLILTILAISENEDVGNFTFNLYVGNALSFDWNLAINPAHKNAVFDIIVGNPPYVGASKIDIETRSLLKHWSVASVGKADLYIPFFQVALRWLKEG